MDSDDVQVGRILSRRDALALLGASGAAFLAACSSGTLTSPSPSAAGTAAGTAQPVGTAGAAAAGAVAIPSCIVRPELTEGPYFVDEKLDRSDIRSDPATGAVRPGATLTLAFSVARVSAAACTALSGAAVDVWHCDALGAYSDTRDAGFNTVGQKFLRGNQTTDSTGKVQFTTVYPGWYQGRAVHIHFKIRTAASAGAAREFTSQLFFDDALTDEVHAQPPYSQKGPRTVRNSGDGIFRGSGDKLLLDTRKSGSGYAAAFDIGLA
jgi:protocatechuate 3,4-dioxygenase beta subunit